jgi:hypothetical protein
VLSLFLQEFSPHFPNHFNGRIPISVRFALEKSFGFQKNTCVIHREGKSTGNWLKGNGDWD